ncbi:hypothetical protein OM187_16220, partial [Escherichia albertii]|nr:hypothetical protein [Escherichia albertii]
LAAHDQSQYPSPAPAKSGVGLSILTNFTDDTMARLRFFCVVCTATSQWWAGRWRRKTRRCQ